VSEKDERCGGGIGVGNIILISHLLLERVYTQLPFQRDEGQDLNYGALSASLEHVLW
jgi:hypothetical protein